MTASPSADCIRLTVPGHLSYLAVCQSCAREFARKIGFAGRALSDIELSVEEAVSNVVRHAFDPQDAETFDLICSRIPLGLMISIKEKGMPFDPARLPEYDPAALGDDAPAAGLGLFLMKKAMDEVSFRNLGAGGKETRMVKYLAAKNIRQYFSADELRPHGDAATAQAERPRKIDYDVRLLRPEEAIEVSKCAYKSHGYTFFDDHIYYPERIVELNRTGEMVSAVGVTDGGVFMGHAALVYPTPAARIAEWTFGFVNPEFRGQGFLKRSYDFLVDLHKPRPLSGLYSYCVTNHDISQKTVAKFGIGDCGILLATSPATWQFKGMDSDTSQRMSVVLSFKYLAGPEPLTLYAPPQHRAMIERLYGHIGGRPRFAEPGPDQALPRPAASVIDTAVNMSEGCADIMLRSCGSQAARELRALVHELCLKQIATLNLFVSLEDPAAFSLAAEFEQLGFFFAGVLPCSEIGDALILQYLNNVPLDYGKLRLHTDMAREILAYIRARDPNACLQAP